MRYDEYQTSDHCMTTGRMPNNLDDRIISLHVTLDTLNRNLEFGSGNLGLKM
jgi:hypothetical protein